MCKHKHHKHDCCCTCCSCCKKEKEESMTKGYSDMPCCTCDKGNGPIEAILFWLIACGSGLLNNNSVLIILLFLLFGFSGDNLGSMFGN